MKFHYKISFIVSAIICALFFIPQPETQTATFTNPQPISIDSQLLSSTDPLIAPFTTHSTYHSPEHQSDFSFSSVGLSWKQISPETTHLEAFIRFRHDQQWSEWLDLEEEEDPLKPGYKYALASTDAADSFQYKFELYGDGVDAPVISDTEWTFLKVEKATYSEAPKPQYFASNPVLSQAKYLALNVNNQEVITRKDWGADESKRYLGEGEELVLIERDEEFYQKYQDELQYSRVVESDQNGGRYVWPLQYPEEVSKIVVHHTATTSNLENPKQAIRDIYHYHALTRGWGDIGYNYIVDQTGNIYEGRYGGEGVIGAHSGPGNHGSIGVAMLGNYQNNPVAEEAIIKLSHFLYGKGKIHDIDLDGHSDFRGKDRPNIFGHRDIMSTTCPGEHLYQKLPLIRTLSANAFVEKEKFVKDYDYQDQSDLYYLELAPRETETITLQMENIGTETWDQQTFLQMKVNPEFENTLSFPDKQGLILARMQESTVEPGQLATFEVSLEAGPVGKTVYLDVAPVMNGVRTPEDFSSLAVAVLPPVYKYEIVKTNYPPKVMQAGDSFDGSVTLKNIGNVIWKNITLSEGGETFSVQPGETATFHFTFKAPRDPGANDTEFALDLPFANWVGSEPLSFETFIFDGEYSSEFISRTLTANWTQGENYTLKINLRNTGLESWNRSDLHGVFLKQDGINISDISMSPSQVSTGETAQITFTVDVQDDAEVKSGNVLVANLYVNDQQISRPIPFKYKVNAKKFQVLDNSEDEDDIRIKLSFDGEPKITANGSFDIYAGEELLRSVSAGDQAAVSIDQGKYKVVVDGTGFLKSEPIRFVPKSSAILEISNYENRPAWNQALNDNQYRGILEVRQDDGELIVINELPLEYYLKGLGEVSNSEETEKIKAIMVAARSYAKYYISEDQKFPGKPYHLDDDPEVSQKYLGFGLEKRSPKVTDGVNATKGKVISYNGKVVKAPYFNQSDGIATKSAQSVWGWTNTPYLISVSDTLCQGDGQFKGHGVGLSGCGAKGMAQQGSSYLEILEHYYSGIEILDLW